ncbi:MAG: flippase-like domain-containing protein [Chitinispirillaceae bacterium]|nr:flippase-like domain-containing protein [Chitinispirillaceae bacterium]
MKKHKRIFFYIRIATAISIIVSAFFFFDFTRIGTEIKKADIRFVIISFLLGLFTLFFWSIRLRTSLGYFVSIPLKKIFYSLLVGKLYGYFAPGTLGSDVSIVLSLRSKDNRLRTTVAAFLLDRLLSIPSIVCIMIVFLPFIYSEVPHNVRAIIIGMLSAGAMTAIFFVIIYFFNPFSMKEMLKKWMKKGGVDECVYFPAIVFADWKRACAICALGIVMNGCIQVGTFCLLKAVHLDIDFFYSMAVLPLNSLLTMIPISIMGIGVREGGFFYLLSAYSISMENVIAFNLIGYFFELVVMGIAGVTFIVTSIKSTSINNGASLS